MLEPVLAQVCITLACITFANIGFLKAQQRKLEARPTFAILGENGVAKEPRLAPLAAAPVGFEEALCAHAAEPVAGLRVSRVDVAVAGARFAKFAYRAKIINK